MSTSRRDGPSTASMAVDDERIIHLGETTERYAELLGGSKFLPAIARAARDATGSAYAAISVVGKNGHLERFVPSGPVATGITSEAISALGDIMATAGFGAGSPSGEVLQMPIVTRTGLVGSVFAAGWSDPAPEAAHDALADMARYAARALELDDPPARAALDTSVLAALSHEVRTPLAVVLGIARTLEIHDQELGDGPRREMLQRLTQNAQRLNAIISELLELGRLERHLAHLILRSTDIGAVVRMVVAESGIVGEHPLHFETDKIVTAVDASKLERIVESLLANIERHTPPGTPAWIRIQDQDDRVLICVDDAGPGVDPDEREAIFEALRVGSSAPNYAPGTGIGLALVARYAELHGGRAWVEEREGGGASFRVTLPKQAEP